MATLTDQLAEAQAAYHDLQLGKAVRVYVDQNGERVEYSVANRSALLAYINDLKQQIADEAAGATPCKGPMRPYFI